MSLTNESTFPAHLSESWIPTFDFEVLSRDQINRQLSWFHENWTLSIKASIVYLITISALTQYMKARPAYQLKTPLIIWNTLLAVFSIFGTIRTLPELVSMVSSSGLVGSSCVSDFHDHDIRLFFWYFAFIYSKLAELGDTIFIVLRKKNLIFLHWYHHISTMTYCFYATSELPASSRWFIGMNFTIHSIMYSYYALRAADVKISSRIALLITSGQILQMILGLTTCIIGLIKYSKGDYCDMSLGVSLSGLVLYSSFAYLFCDFFHKAYFVRGKKVRSGKSEEKENREKEIREKESRDIENQESGNRDDESMKTDNTEINNNIRTQNHIKVN